MSKRNKATSTKSRGRVLSVLMTLMLTAGLLAGTASPASADAQTCIGAPSGWMCTNVSGSGTYVGTVYSSRGHAGGWSICNYSAWFFYIPPTGGAYDMGTEHRAGCGYGRVHVSKDIRRVFPRNTLVCTKFYENNWATFIGQRCVGVS